MTWKKVSNSDSGTATKHGGNDIDKIADAFNGVDVSDPIKYNTDINTLYATTNAAGDLLKSNGTKFVRLPRGTANQVLGVNAGGTDVAWTSAPGGGATALDGLSDVAITSAARGDIIVRDATQYVNKAKGTAGQVLTMNAGATDPVWATPSSSAAAVQPFTYFIYKDPADSLYKARRGNDGTLLATTSSTNATLVLDAVVADISPPTTPAVIEFASGDFPMTTVFNNITVPVIGNLTIRGQGMGATNLIPQSAISGGTIFEVFGSVSGSATNLTANAVAGAMTIAVTSAAAFAAGDTILLRSNAVFSTAASAQGKKGELRKIVSIATNTITLDKWIHDTYNTADTANIIKVVTLDNVTFSDLTIKAASAYTGTGTFVSFRFCDNLRIDRIQVVNARNTGVNLTSCINFTVDTVLEQTPTSTATFIYGCTVTCASENGRVHITGLGKWRHVFTIDASGTANFEGQVRNIEVSGEAETNEEACWDTHATGENISFRGCNVHGTRAPAAADAKGFQMRAKRCNVQNCNVWEGVGKGITIGEDASGSIISGCNVVNTRELDNATLGYGIEIRGGCNDIIVTGNQIIGSKREGILLRTPSSGHTITNNIIQNSGAEGIDATDCTSSIIANNRITGNSKALNLSGTTDSLIISDNIASGNTSTSTVVGSSNKIWNNMGDTSLINSDAVSSVMAADFPNASTLGTTYVSLAGGNANATLNNRSIPVGFGFTITAIRARVNTNSLNTGTLTLAFVDDGVAVASCTIAGGTTGVPETTGLNVAVAAGSVCAFSLNTGTAASGSYECRPVTLEIKT